MPRVAHALAWMRVGEGDPDFGHLVLGEEMLNLVDAGAKESHVAQAFLVALFQSAPNACALDVNTYVINIAVRTGQANRVFAFAAAEFQNDGIVVVEKVLVPLALQWEPFLHDAFVAVFKQVREGLVLGESFQFVLFRHSSIDYFKIHALLLPLALMSRKAAVASSMVV